MQGRVEERYYAKALTFAQELGDVIYAGVIAAPHASEDAKPHLESYEGAPNKSAFADIRERRKLGKRILKAVQPHLESALRVEAEISNKPFETLQRELEAKMEASLDITKAASAYNREADGLGTIMVDASPSTEIRVRAPLMARKFEVTNEDAMELDEPESGNIEVNTSGLGIVNGGSSVDVEMTEDTEVPTRLTNGVESSQTPPNSNGYGPSPKRGNTAQKGPPTPPQSNGSFGKDADLLADGGVLWFLKPFEPDGTTILGELDSAGTNSRMLSEDLTDLDDDELKALGAEVDASLHADVDGDADGDADSVAVSVAAAGSDKTVQVAAALPRGKASRAAAAAAAASSPQKRRTSARRR